MAPIPDILCEYLASGVGPNIRGFRLKTYTDKPPGVGGGEVGSNDFGQKTLARIIIEKWPERGGGQTAEGHIVWQYDFEVWQLQECALPDKNSKFGTPRRVRTYIEVFLGSVRVLLHVLNTSTWAKDYVWLKSCL